MADSVLPKTPSNIPPSSNLPQRHEPTALAPVRPYVPPLPEEDPDRISLHEIAALISRRRWQILATALALVAIAAVQVFTMTPYYKATATLQIDSEQPKIELYEQEASFSSRDSEEYLFTQAKNLQTKALARRVVTKLGLGENPIFMGKPNTGFFTDRVRDVSALIRRIFAGSPQGQGSGVDRFLANLDVQMEHNTRLVQVSFSSPDPELAAEVANSTVDEFIAQSFEVRFEATRKASEFLEEKLQDLRRKVEESESRALRYARENDIVNLNDKETVNRQRLIDLNAELTRVESSLIEKTARFRLVQGATPDSLPESLANAQIQGLKARIIEAESKLANMSASYGPSWPAVVQQRGELEDLRAQLRTENARAIQNARQAYEAELDHKNRLTSAVKAQRELVEKLDESAIQYNLQRGEVDTNKQLYEGLLERLKETAVATGLRATNIRLVDQATVSARPSSPKKLQSISLALVLGLGLGLAGAFMLEAFDRTLKTPDDVSQHLRLPTVGVIQHMGPQAKRFNLPFGRQADNARSRPFFIFQSGSQLSKAAGEAYRSLRTAIVLSGSDRPIRTIMVTSPLPSEGKTTTACNFAAVLAQTGSQTAIVDLDMRRSKVAGVFGVRDDQGMSSYLSGNAGLNSLFCETADPRLLVLAAGPHPPNPSELIASERMRMGLGLLAEHFDYVVIDTPPAAGVSDALSLARQVDGVLIVVRSGQTPIRAAKQLAASLVGSGARVLGVVMNDAPQQSREFDYYPGSYYYSNYYAPDEGA